MLAALLCCGSAIAAERGRGADSYPVHPMRLVVLPEVPTFVESGYA